MSNDLTRHTDKELELARSKGQVIGWAQGAGAVIAVSVVLSLIGWIPAVIVLGGVGYLVYRALSPKRAPRE
jgi:hypothetical protein